MLIPVTPFGQLPQKFEKLEEIHNEMVQNGARASDIVLYDEDSGRLGFYRFTLADWVRKKMPCCCLGANWEDIMMSNWTGLNYLLIKHLNGSQSGDGPLFTLFVEEVMRQRNNDPNDGGVLRVGDLKSMANYQEVLPYGKRVNIYNSFVQKQGWM